MTTGFTTQIPMPRISENYKAAFDKTGTSKPQRKIYNLNENSWASRYKHYSKLREAYPLFDKACLGLAGLVMSQGIFHKPAVKKNDETYGLAEEACWRADQFRDKRYVNSKLFNTIDAIAFSGSCFWELSDNETFDFRIPPLQEYIEPYKANDQGEITDWRQVINGSTKAEWTSDQLKLISFRPTTATWPFGNGLGVGLETEMEMLVDMETSVKDYSEKAAWPYEILALGDKDSMVADSDYSTARTEWKNRKPGEGIACRNMAVDIKAGGTNSAPIRELAAICEFMKDNVHDGLVVPPVSKLYNSTEASAKELRKQVMDIIGQPLQWLLKEHYEQDILKAFMIQQGYSVKSCPAAMFEAPDVHKKEEGEYWVSLVNAKIQSPLQACDHMDLEYDENYWKQEEQKQMEFQKQKLEATPKEEGESPKQREGKSFKVTELFPEAEHKRDII